MARGWNNPAHTARRLQTLFERQRPRLRQRVLQRCAPEDGLEDRLDHVLDTQRDRLADGADLSLAKLEADALDAIHNGGRLPTPQETAHRRRDYATPGEMGPLNPLNPAPPISPRPPSGGHYGIGNRILEDRHTRGPLGGGEELGYTGGNRILEDAHSRQISRDPAEVESVPHGRRARRSSQVLHGRRASNVSGTFPPPRIVSQVPLDLGYQVPHAPGTRPNATPPPSERYYNHRARAVDEFAVLAERSAAAMLHKEQEALAQAEVQKREYYRELQRQEKEKSEIAQREREKAHEFHMMQVKMRQQWQAEERQEMEKLMEARRRVTADRKRDMAQKVQRERERREQELEAERRSNENVERQMFAEKQRQLYKVMEQKAQFEQVLKDNAVQQKVKDEMKKKLLNDDIELAAEYARRLEKEEKNRKAQYDAIYERMKKQDAQSGETYKAIDEAKAAEEAAFMARLAELEEQEKRREAEKQAKLMQDQVAYRSALDTQVQEHEKVRQRALQDRAEQREKILHDMMQGESEEAKKQSELAARQNQYLRDIQAQMASSMNGGIDFDRHDIEGSKHVPFPRGYKASQCDGSFNMSETERRMNRL